MIVTHTKAGAGNYNCWDGKPMLCAFLCKW